LDATGLRLSVEAVDIGRYGLVLVEVLSLLPMMHRSPLRLLDHAASWAMIDSQ